MPTIRSGGVTQNVPAFATLFKFMTADTAAATRNRIPIRRIVLADKLLPPLSGALLFSTFHFETCFSLECAGLAALLRPVAA
jgi:hypothetical protein